MREYEIRVYCGKNRVRFWFDSEREARESAEYNSAADRRSGQPRKFYHMLRGGLLVDILTPFGNREYWSAAQPRQRKPDSLESALGRRLESATGRAPQ